MVWIRTDDHFDEEPELLLATAEDVGVWMRLKAYANRRDTDGFVPDAYVSQMQRRGWNVARAVEHMHAIGMLARDEARAGVVILRHLETNPGREQREATRASKSEAGRKGGEASAQARWRKSPVSLDSDQAPASAPVDDEKPSTLVLGNPDPGSRPDPDPVPERDREAPAAPAPAPEPLRLEPQSGTRLRAPVQAKLPVDPPKLVTRADVVAAYRREYEVRYCTPNPPGMNIGLRAADTTAGEALRAAVTERQARGEGAPDVRTLALEAITWWCARFLANSSPAVLSRRHALQMLPNEIQPAGFPPAWTQHRPAPEVVRPTPYRSYTPQSRGDAPRAWTPGSRSRDFDDSEEAPHVDERRVLPGSR